MSRQSFAGATLLPVALFTLLALGGVSAYLLLRGREGDPNNAPDKEKPPPQERVAPSIFRESAQEAGIDFRMSFLSGEQGANFKINLYDHGCGVAVADFNQDGHDDVYFVNQLGPNKLYRNKGDGTFEDVTERAGVGLGDRVCVAAAWGDYDNDGYPDLYVTSTRGGNVLFHNNRDGTFTDVTRQAGVKLVAHSQTATYFDYDNDGFLDLFVTNSAQWTTDEYDRNARYYPGLPDFWKMATSPKEYNVLYHNNGDGTFTDVTQKSGLKGQGWGGDVAVFDYNEDGKLDLFVTNMFGASQLYRNNGDGTFTDVTQQTLGKTSWGAIGSKAFDLDNDGHLDLFVADMHSDMWLSLDADPVLENRNLKKKYPNVLGPMIIRKPELAAEEDHYADRLKVRYNEVLFGNTLFLSRPGKKFEEVSDKAGAETWWPWGIATGDFDNDGHEDVFVPSGMGYPYRYWPNQLLMNNGNETFTDRAAEAGIEPPPGGRYQDELIGGKRATRSSRCAATVFNKEGRLDLVVNNFNGRAYYFRNIFPKKNYIAFRLTGARRAGEPPGTPGSNRDAVGALVYLHLGKEVMVRQVQAAGGYLSQSSQTLHFGLGERTRVDWAEVRWPSGRRQRIDNPVLNKRHELPEPKGPS
ncbi:MAG TPA: CRTAC1 family protein [Gemmataceae bacterium]|nr:CRTAC1 family protein [Gemmataceae bacterium]